MLFLIFSHCLRCIIIGHSKWGRFGAILNSFTLSKMHYYWLLKVGALLSLLAQNDHWPLSRFRHPGLKARLDGHHKHRRMRRGGSVELDWSKSLKYLPHVGLDFAEKWAKKEPKVLRTFRLSIQITLTHGDSVHQFLSYENIFPDARPASLSIQDGGNVIQCNLAITNLPL